jgi:hypothetical protein
MPRKGDTTEKPMVNTGSTRTSEYYRTPPRPPPPRWLLRRTARALCLAA